MKRRQRRGRTDRHALRAAGAEPLLSLQVVGLWSSMTLLWLPQRSQLSSGAQRGHSLT